MLVSGFHLEFAGAWDARNPAYTSGYELEITNLSGQHIDFEVVAKVTRYASGTIFSPPESPATKLANLKRLIPGVLKDDRWSWFDGGWRHDSGGYSLHITMPIDAGASQFFYMNPSIYESNKSWWPRVAGHIELTIPAVRAAEPPYEWIPQADGPVPVLVNPSTVETWDVVTGAAGGAFSHSRTTPPLTTGQARVEIPPDTDPSIVLISVRDLLTQKMRGAAGVAHVIAGLSPEERAQALIDLLAAVGEDEQEQAALNEVLGEMGSSVRVSGPPERD